MKKSKGRKIILKEIKKYYLLSIINLFSIIFKIKLYIYIYILMILCKINKIMTFPTYIEKIIKEMLPTYTYVQKNVKCSEEA